MHIGRMKILGRVTFVENLAEVMASQQTVSGVGFIWHILSSWWWSAPSVLRARVQRCLFWVSIYRRNSHTQNVELLSIFGSLAIFTDLYLDLKAKLIGGRLLSSLAQTLFWEEIHHSGCIRQGQSVFTLVTGMITHAPVFPADPHWLYLVLFTFIYLFISQMNFLF